MEKRANRLRGAIWLAVVSGLAIPASAQIRTPDLPVSQEGGWRRAGDPAPNQQPNSQEPRNPTAAGPATDQSRQLDQPPGPLVIRAGTFLNVRLDQLLSSDGSDPGDQFAATLARSIIVDGRVVAQRGQTVIGRVLEVHRGGRKDSPARLVLEVVGLTLVDGVQVSVRSDLIARARGRSTSNEVGMVASTTATGAMIGAIAGGGVGAGIGAIIGGAAGATGMLALRGGSVVLYPEMQMAFRLESDVRIEGSRSPQAFRPADRSDYELQLRPRGYCGGYPCPPAPAYGPGPGPYWYAPSASIYIGHGYWR